MAYHRPFEMWAKLAIMVAFAALVAATIVIPGADEHARTTPSDRQADAVMLHFDLIGAVVKGAMVFGIVTVVIYGAWRIVRSHRIDPRTAPKP